MLKIFYKLFILLLMTTSSTVLWASEVPNGNIKGIVLEKDSGVPIEYATVMLYALPDSIMITGNITGPTGEFTLKDVENGSYYLMISFMGFESMETEVFEINKNNRTQKMGTIYLNPSGQLLEEVEIVANHHKIEYQIDKKVISVNQQLASASQTAVEILESVPSIRVDIEGNVSLRGSSGLTVLIDGKPTVLDASDVLSQLPASTIQNIEIITNPSAKYEPDGSGGIINIITKKSRSTGFQGLINASTNTFGMYRGDVLLNYNTGSINYFISGQYGTRPRIGESFNERRTTNMDTLTTILSMGEYERKGGRNEIKGGFSWEISKSDLFSAEFRMGKYQRKSISTLDYQTTREIDDFDLREISKNESERAGIYQNYTANYRHQFNSGEHDLKVQLNYSRRNGTEYAENYLSNEANQINTGSRTTEDGPSNRLDFKLDYRHPFTDKSALEGGFQYRSSFSDDITNFYLYNAESDDFIVQEQFWNNTNYARNIFAAYGLYRGESGNFGYQMGLRAEYTYRKISTASENKEYIIDRGDYFPSFHLSYNLPAEQQVMASYSRRIDRPRSYYLEPFLTWSDFFNVRRGNPDLIPEYIDAFELGYLKEWEQLRFSLEAYHRIQYNKVERVVSVFDEGVLLSSFENVGTDYSSGLESMINFSMFKWWDLTLMGNVYNYRIEGQRDSEAFEFESFNWSSRLDNTFKLHENLRLQITGQYNGPSVTSQGKHFEYYELNTGVRMDFFSNQLSTVFQIRDIFGTHRHRSLSEGAGFYNYSERTTSGPIFSLSLSYRINNYKVDKKKDGPNGNEGEGMGGDME